MTDSQLTIVALVTFLFLFLSFGFLFGYNTGIEDGRNEIRQRDHVQATAAGIFIDGYANNKVYDLKLREQK